MIDELHVRNVALIRDASIEPAAGLTVLTGETGAGKTALLSSIKLLVGERADAGMVREGAPALEVEGRLFLPGDDEDGTVVRRRVGADGRGRVDVDGHMASVRELARRVGATVDLCGQHEHQRLLSVQTHVDMLDSWAGAPAGDALGAYREALSAAEAAASELERVREMGRATGERLDEAAFVLRRIDEVDPREGELEELEARLPRAEHGEALMEAASGARELLSGDGGACDALGDAVRALSDAARFDPALGSWAKVLESSLIDVEDVASELRDYADGLDFDPEELERLQGRLARLEGLRRAYGPSMADVLRRRDEAREVVEAASDGGELERRAAEELRRREAALAEAADALDAVRAEAAPRLARAVSEQMAFLEMGSAELVVSQERLPRAEWTRSGASRVEFLYRPGAGLTARPLRKIASGGEVSRVMLACKVVLGEADDCETLVFDEVDAGVGGATAVALASVLARLAATHQVIVVTHLAQVAVAAERHYLVRKSEGESGVPETSLVEISGEDRVAEVSRMLSGDTGEASRDLAREMLERRAERGDGA
ncbi:DNA repair protein RecN [Thermophilibacter provencensis]|uniref:DNA repair protein RecN n=1 Tax=Thermophilibacter provencensis TaxID=1852386 RepID=UPI00094B6EF4|nr:DNA repair protein RecN [Thermophilibacter provencensis]